MQKSVSIILLLTAASAQADIIYPQLPIAPPYGIIATAYDNAFGQSFIATTSESLVKTVSFLWAGSPNVSIEDPSYNVKLLSGEGFAGTVLGAQTVIHIPQSTPEFTWIDFTFSSPITLTSGQTYTLRFAKSNNTGPASGSYVSLQDVYAGGTRYTGANSGSPRLNNDLGFRILSVPEPATLCCLAVGASVCLLFRRDR